MSALLYQTMMGLNATISWPKRQQLTFVTALEEHHISESESLLRATQNTSIEGESEYLATYPNTSTCKKIFYLNACSTCILPKLNELSALCKANSYIYVNVYNFAMWRVN